MSHLTRRLLGVVQIPLWLILQWVPKERACWVFGAWNGQRYSDNARYIFEEVLRSYPEIHPVWIVKNKVLLAELRSLGLPVEYAYSLQGLWAQVRASVAVFSHSVEWDLVATCIAGRCLRIQGWHGIPIKRIGYLDEKGVSRNRAALISLLFPHRTDRCDLMLAAGSYDQEVFRKAFNVAADDVVITGYPRNDALSLAASRPRAAPQVFIYLPTLRGAAGQDFDLFARTGLDLHAFDAELGLSGLSLYIKLHPAQRVRDDDVVALAACKNIHLLAASFDINARLSDFDALITDVSSVYFDFLFLGRPIILALLNMAMFSQETRNLLAPVDDFDLGFSADSWKGLLEQMKRLHAAGPFEPNELYCIAKERFFSIADDGAAQRAVAEIRRRLEP